MHEMTSRHIEALRRAMLLHISKIIVDDMERKEEVLRAVHEQNEEYSRQVMIHTLRMANVKSV